MIHAGNADIQSKFRSDLNAMIGSNKMKNFAEVLIFLPVESIRFGNALKEISTYFPCISTNNLGALDRSKIS